MNLDVWVVTKEWSRPHMGDDTRVVGVFATEAAAQAYIEERKKEREAWTTYDYDSWRVREALAAAPDAPDATGACEKCEGTGIDYDFSTVTGKMEPVPCGCAPPATECGPGATVVVAGTVGCWRCGGSGVVTIPQPNESGSWRYACPCCGTGAAGGGER